MRGVDQIVCVIANIRNAALKVEEEETEKSRTELKTHSQAMGQRFRDGSKYQEYYEHRLRSEFGYPLFGNGKILQLLQEYIPDKVNMFKNIEFDHRVGDLLMKNGLEERSVFAVTYDADGQVSVLDLSLDDLVSDAMKKWIMSNDQDLTDKNAYTCTSMGDGTFTVAKSFDLPELSTNTVSEFTKFPFQM